MRYLICTFLGLILCVGAQTETKAFDLSIEERAFLAKHRTFSVHVEENYAPFSFIENGQFKGFSVDFSNLIAQRLGIQFHYKRKET